MATTIRLCRKERGGVGVKRLVLLSFLFWLLWSSSPVLAEHGLLKKPNYVAVTGGLVSGDFLFGDDLETKIEFPDPPGRNPLPSADLNTGYLFSAKCGRLLHAPYREHAPIKLAVELEGLIIGGTDVNNEFSGKFFRLVPEVPEETDPALVIAPVTANADIAIQGLMLNVLLVSPGGSFHPYGGIGLGWSWFESDTVFTLRKGLTWPGTDSRVNDLGKLDDDSFAGQLLLGCQWDMTERLALDAGYRYFRIDHAELGGPGFDFHVEYEVEMFTLGVMYRF
jgi:hypothetical protein